MAHEIREACMTVGFFYSKHKLFTPCSSYKLLLPVTGHGILQDVIDDLFANMEAYFSLPLETKMKVTRALV